MGEKRVRHYLTGVDMWLYHKEKNYWGCVLNPPLRYIARNYDFIERRKQWVDIRRSLNALGYDIKPLAFDHNDYY